MKVLAARCEHCRFWGNTGVEDKSGATVFRVPEGTYHTTPPRRECSKPAADLYEPADYKYVPLPHGYREAFMTTAVHSCKNFERRLSVVTEEP